MRPAIFRDVLRRLTVRHLTPRRQIPHRLTGAAVLIGVWLAGTTESFAQNTTDLRARLGALDAQVQALRAELGGGSVTSADATADVFLKLGRLEEELARLTGQVERLQFRLDRIADDATRRFGDIEFRLTELEGGDISELGEPAPLGGTASQSAGGNQQLAVVQPEVSISERGDLDRAVNDVQQGRFDLAEDRLRTFLSSYPGSPLTSQAFYWLGESQFVRGAFPEAARSYLGGYNADRTGSAAPENLLKLGVTLGKLGQLSEACLTLREVRSQFPGADEAVVSAADEEADRLACG